MTMRNAMNRGSFFFRLPVFLCLLLLAGAFSTEHADAAAAPSLKGGNTRITSEKLTYDSGKNQVIFEGKVHVTRQAMEIWSDLLTVLLDDSGQKPSSGSAGAMGMGGGKVERIIAEKNVRIKQENKVGTCGKATYFVNEGRIVMEQDPVIVDGENNIRGKTITYYTQTGRSVVTSDPSRPVVVQFSTDDKGPLLPGAPGSSGQDAPGGEGTRQ